MTENYSGNMYYNKQFTEINKVLIYIYNVKDQMEKLVDEIKMLRETLLKYEEKLDKDRHDKI
jgi:hypothetical protein